MIENRTPFLGVCTVDGNKMKHCVCLNNLDQTFSLRKLVFDDLEGEHMHSLWCAPIRLDTENEIVCESKQAMHQSIVDFFIACPMINADLSNKWSCLCKSWKTRSSSNNSKVPAIELDDALQSMHNDLSSA